MSYLFYDVETTGLSKQSSILSLAAVQCNDEFEIQNVYNEYYLYGGEVPSGAVAVHGLTSQKLEFLAERDFMEASADVYDLFAQPDITVCGHNIEAYDNNVLSYNLEICGYTLPSFKTYDTLKMARAHLPGRHRLEDCVVTLAGMLGCSNNFTEQLFKDCKLVTDAVIDKDMQFHSALYDTFCSYCIGFLMRELWNY